MVNPTQKLLSQLERHIADPGSPFGFFLREKYPICFSNATDPFQRAEKQYRASETVMQWCKQMDMPTFIQTKGNVLHEEFERYAPLLISGKDVVYISITFQDDKLRKRIEPGALSIEKRWELAKMLTDHGIPVVIAANPYTKDWIPDIEAYCQQTKDVGAAGVWLSALHLTPTQTEVIPLFYQDKIIDKANLSNIYLVPLLKKWYKITADFDLDFFPTPYWDHYFGDRAKHPECVDPMWHGGNHLDFAFQVLRSVSETSRVTDDSMVMFSWPDIQKYLEATGVPNPILHTRAFERPYYTNKMNADLRCWAAKLGKHAPFYEIIRYFFNHPWENQNFCWHHPKIKTLFDHEQHLYVSDKEADLIAIYDPRAKPTDKFTFERNDVDWNSVIWWDIERWLKDDSEEEDAEMEQLLLEVGSEDDTVIEPG